MRNNTALHAAVAAVTAIVQDRWEKAVMGASIPSGMTPLPRNNRLRQSYRDSISANQLVITDTRIESTIVASSQIAVQLENGCGSFDMKPMLLSHASTGKKGKYKVVPFSHGFYNFTSKVTKPMRKSLMPDLVYRNASQLVNTCVHGGVVVQRGSMLTGTEAMYPASRNNTTGEQHASGKYENMYKILNIKTKSKAKLYFMTFRTVTENQNGLWIHPGFKAHNVAKAVADSCARDATIINMIESAAVNSILDIAITGGGGI